MAELVKQTPGLSGDAVAFAAASAGGDTFINDGKTVLHVKNAHTNAWTVTVDSVTPCNHGFDHNVAVAVPAGGERIIGPFPVDRFGTTVTITYTGVTALSVAAVRT